MHIGRRRLRREGQYILNQDGNCFLGADKLKTAKLTTVKMNKLEERILIPMGRAFFAETMF